MGRVSRNGRIMKITTKYWERIREMGCQKIDKKCYELHLKSMRLE
jgi:hypothetical protein